MAQQQNFTRGGMSGWPQRTLSAACAVASSPLRTAVPAAVRPGYALEFRDTFVEVPVRR